GRGGNLQHFLKAKLKNTITHDVDIDQYKYEYSVLLPISDEPYVIDFIVGASDESGNLYTLDNPPAVKYEKDFMPGMLSRDGVPGYWQRVVVPKVEPEPNQSGTGYLPSSDGNDYKAKPIAEMKDIQLVRNFAEVTITSTSDAKFTINKFVLVDYPKNGDIAPFDAAETVGYKTPYMGHNTDYAGIVNNNYKYLGYSTVKTLETGIADTPTFTTSGQYSFLYERPAPSDAMPESGAVIEVTWKNVDGVDAALKGQTRYYKIAFTGESGYVPILRNIAYTFQISDFKTPTHHTSASDAYNGSWLGDISANVATANLDEIANSVSRIIVSEMSKTHIGDATTTPYSIYFQYYPNTQTYANEVAVVNGTNFHGKNVKVVASIEAVSGYGAAISSITQPVSDGSYASGATWGRVDVQTYGSRDAVLRSKLKILCQLEGQTALYREVIFTVMEKQEFNNGINASIDAVEDGINKQTILHLRIPADLPKDIFPLQVRIESQANNLTSIPVGTVEALPVKYGLSAFDNSKYSYYFVKTINWDDYAHLSGETYTYTTEFPCYFKTTLESGNETSISLQDLTTTKGVNEGRYFHEMILYLGNGITVSPSSQTVANNVTSATVRVASSSAWTLGAHDGLTVASGSQTSGEAGSYEITFTFDPNDTDDLKRFTAEFTSDDGSTTAEIIQSPRPSYSLDLTQWRASTAVTAPTGYSIYESNSNYHTGNGIATMTITLSGYTEFSFYIRSYAEGSYDYVIVNKLDEAGVTTWNSGSTYSQQTVKAHTRGNQQAGTALDDYTLVTFDSTDGLDGGTHTIVIQYGKDGYLDSNNDRGYVLISNGYNLKTN
ncbi:MAG: BACON domain-containing protein, partial [Bacteroidales bacterium]|nr:BACON domain-containing protein [Bacteroidales bacterium]